MSKRAIQIIFYNNPDEYPPIINGVRMLVQAGWQVEILCRDSGKTWGVAYPAEANVIRIRSEGRSSWQEYLAFVTRLLRHGSRHVSLIYAHDMHALVPARMLATLYRRPLVYHSHDFADESQQLPTGSRVVHAFQQKFARTVDLVIIPDADRAKVISRSLHLKRDPLIVANAPLNRPVPRSTALHQAITIRDRNFTKVMIRQGRIGIGHAIESTIRSIPLWVDQHWGFVLMGVGESSYIEKLNQDARMLGIERQFIVLPPVGYDQIMEFTPAANVGHALYDPTHINNVHITTASNKIMEYMAAGLPLLVSNTSSLRALIEEHKCGITADERSPQSIAAAVNLLLRDSEHARSIGASARRAFEETFCYERQFAKVLVALDSLSRLC